MKKSAKFLIAENPMVDDDRVFVVHTQEPFFIAEAFHFTPDQEEDWMDCKRHFPIGSSVDYPGEMIVLGVLHLSIDDFDVNELPKLMSRMGDWYHAYLKWEDSQ